MVHPPGTGPLLVLVGHPGPGSHVGQRRPQATPPDSRRPQDRRSAAPLLQSRATAVHTSPPRPSEGPAMNEPLARLDDWEESLAARYPAAPRDKQPEEFRDYR